MADDVVNAVARELLDAAAMLGFTYLGIDGNGHHAVRHENGQTYRIPSTPSEYRSRLNALAEMERIAGRKLPRPGRRRKSHKAFGGSGFSMEVAVREARQREEHRVRVAGIRRAAQQAAEERARRLAQAERRRLDIEALMRPGWFR